MRCASERNESVARGTADTSDPGLRVEWSRWGGTNVEVEKTNGNISALEVQRRQRETGGSAGVVVARCGAVRWNEGMKDVWCCGATTWFGSSTSLLWSANLFPLAWPRRKIKVQVGECEWVALVGLAN